MEKYLSKEAIRHEKRELLIEAERLMQEAQELLQEILHERGLCLDEKTKEIVPLADK